MKRLTDKRLALPPGVWQEVTDEQRMELQEIPVPPMRDLYYRLSRMYDRDGAPLGEVELVRHAHWENTGGNEKVGLAYGTCSHCHREAWANYELTPRCPYCGAHMDEVKS